MLLQTKPKNPTAPKNRSFDFYPKYPSKKGAKIQKSLFLLNSSKLPFWL